MWILDDWHENARNRKLENVLKKYLYLIDHVKSEWDQFSVISRVLSRDMYFKKTKQPGVKAWLVLDSSRFKTNELVN